MAHDADSPLILPYQRNERAKGDEMADVASLGASAAVFDVMDFHSVSRHSGCVAAALRRRPAEADEGGKLLIVENESGCNSHSRGGIQDGMSTYSCRVFGSGREAPAFDSFIGSFAPS